ncbi:hypothetical protein GCM10027280_50890 [Micromonospora polyrhachis]|uniref:Endonuclease/exonuclease/phosphatase family metal-dependent hydrolase/uncharacterized protein (UPF0248 family)/2'-5' RNA ligase n=1 Tax=Micromonospora polyrhachis TaxID=1282883 RepID=A0A7W7SV43_9ACTN|nr:poly(A) polymerase [Micromonospora polyrhachis]MBB4961513.1 endonuclease/exonuclease/phosphatase family metal-dependent hydrolase/uncharacterized protein (UPF0248 family)/2'-5' RNA ligase [Micromonospora polyrhachis]
MRTSEEIYHRIRWDPRFDPARFVLGINVRGASPKRVPLPAFVPGGDIPWHRVLFIEADGEVVWDRSAGVDDLDSSQLGRVRQPRLLRAPLFTARSPYVWDPVAGWCPAATSPTGRVASASPMSAALRVLTWNTLWDRYDSDRIDTARRRPLLLAALERADADLIALQEVEVDLLALLAGSPWIRSRYALTTDPTSREVDGDGLLLLSRLPVREAGRLPLGPYKAVVAITVESAAGPVVVATTHLTSDHADDGPGRRDVELARVAEALTTVDTNLILVGDFNDGGDRPAEALRLRDAWTEVYGSDDRTPTFDPQANPLAAVSSLSGRAGRLDRVLLRGPDLRVADAAVRGDSPATPDNLFVSDHYGVAVDVVVGGTPGGSDYADVLDAHPTARTALVWLPPEQLWSAIQEIRSAHDPQLHRWPPHVSVMFGFVPEADFEAAVSLLVDVVAEIAPFSVLLRGVRAFSHGDDATVWLDPAAAGAAPWIGLRDTVERRFPRCRGRGAGFVPHLSLGRSRKPDRLAADFEVRLGHHRAQVGELVLLSRRGVEPMRPRATVALGTGAVRWVDQIGAVAPIDVVAGTGRVERLVGRLRDALPDAVVHVVGSRRLGCAVAGADLDLVVALPDSVDLTELAVRVAAALPAATDVRPVVGARVPGLRLRVGDLDVDLVVVATAGIPPVEAVSRRTELGEPAAMALSAVSDAEAILAAVDGSRAGVDEGSAGVDESRAGVDVSRLRFVRLAREVKSWARARGLDSAPFGGLPGLAWTILAARTVCDAGAIPTADLLGHFFGQWAAWDWRRPIALRPPPGGDSSGTVPDSPASVPDSSDADQAPAVCVLTPTAPVRSGSEQVGVAGRELLTQELYHAWETVQAASDDGRDPWPELLSPPPLHRRHRAWAIVTVRAQRSEGFGVTLGRVRGRIRALLAALERAGVRDVHAWPRPFEYEPELARFAVGIGPVPPDPARLAEITAPWTAGLAGTSVEWAAGGEVPTLR